MYSNNSPGQGSIVGHVKTLFNNPLGSDVIFKCSSGKEIPAHKIIVCRSPVLQAMFFSGLGESTNEIEIDELTEEGFIEFLRFIYCDEVNLDGKIVLEVLHAANKYQLKKLEEICSAYLEDSIDLENVFFLHQQAKMYDHQSLERRCMNFISRNGESVFVHETFTSLSYKDAFQFIDNDHIYVNELVRYKAALKWGEAQCIRLKIEPTPTNIREQLKDILYCIRFSLMSGESFTEHVTCTNILTPQETIDIYKYISSKGKIPIQKFSCKPRSRLVRKFLILGADCAENIEDVAQHIQRYHDCSQDEWYPCGELTISSISARDMTPSLEELKNFDAILVFSNYNFENPLVLGNHLADYVDSGGGIVVTTFACVKKYSIQGRFLNDKYLSLELGENQTLPKNEEMKKIDPNHPILHGIKDFDPGRYRGDSAMACDSTCVAEWHDGIPLIAVSNLKNVQQSPSNRQGRVVTLNFFPVSSRKNPKYWPSSKCEGGKLLCNALIYASSEDN